MVIDSTTYAREIFSQMLSLGLIIRRKSIGETELVFDAHNKRSVKGDIPVSVASISRLAVALFKVVEI